MLDADAGYRDDRIVLADPTLARHQRQLRIQSGRHYRLLLAAAQVAMSATYEPLLHIVLYQPEIPYNTGSVGRTCVAVGAKLWLVRPLGFRVDDYYLRRAGLDYWEHLAWQVVDDWDELTQLPGGAAAGGFSPRRPSARMLDVRFEPGDVLVFGSESAGLPDATAGRACRLRSCAFPLAPTSEASTLSNAVAVAAYEALRQWRTAIRAKPQAAGIPDCICAELQPLLAYSTPPHSSTTARLTLCLLPVNIGEPARVL